MCILSSVFIHVRSLIKVLLYLNFFYKISHVYVCVSNYFNLETAGIFLILIQKKKEIKTQIHKHFYLLGFFLYFLNSEIFVDSFFPLYSSILKIYFGFTCEPSLVYFMCREFLYVFVEIVCKIFYIIIFIEKQI